MAKTLKRIYAGALQIAALYDRCGPRDTPKQRQAKRQASSEAQRRMNQIYSYQKLELMLAVNFPTPGSGQVVTLTYDEDHLPADRAGVQKDWRNCLRRLRQERTAAQLPAPVAFWAIEVLTSLHNRWHIHAVIDSTGRDLEQLQRAWPYGRIEMEALRVDAEKNHESLARYMTKESRECQDYGSKPGLRSWSCTRNAKKPETDVVTVPDDYELDPPDGCTVLLDESRSTVYASWRVLKIRVGAAGFAAPPRPKRRRPRRKR